ncbi:Uncharacterised protein [Mycobacteroides abscessus subsp. abscessus]|nr:Uncharacterised protein [Mycobacteroides abscessus subsp. abscessus]
MSGWPRAERRGTGETGRYGDPGPSIASAATGARFASSDRGQSSRRIDRPGGRRGGPTAPTLGSHRRPRPGPPVLRGARAARAARPSASGTAGGLRLRRRDRARHAAADAPGRRRVPYGDRTGDRVVHRGVGGVRDRPGGGGHRKPLVAVRGAGDPGTGPGGRPGHHDGGLAVRVARRPADGAADAADRPDRDQDRAARRDPPRRDRRPADEPAGRGGGRDRADRTVSVRL